METHFANKLDKTALGKLRSWIGEIGGKRIQQAEMRAVEENTREEAAGGCRGRGTGILERGLRKPP